MVQDHDHADAGSVGLNRMAASATLHCLTGCSIGEILGLIIGTAAGLSNLATVVVSIALAFVFGYSLSSLPLLRAGLAARAPSPGWSSLRTPCRSPSWRSSTT